MIYGIPEEQENRYRAPKDKRRVCEDQGLAAKGFGGGQGFRRAASLCSKAVMKRKK